MPGEHDNMNEKARKKQSHMGLTRALVEKSGVLEHEMWSEQGWEKGKLFELSGGLICLITESYRVFLVFLSERR